MIEGRPGALPLATVVRRQALRAGEAERPQNPFFWPASPAVMAIINVTPDSFSGSPHDAIQAGVDAINAGADILDIGGESTRPNATPVTSAEEQKRILPVIEALAGRGVPISVDTRNASTMQVALEAGAAIINDVTGLRHDPEAAPLLARHTCAVLLMHMRGTPQTMTKLAVYEDVVGEVLAELEASVDAAVAAGISRDRIAVDPGIGFAKTAEQNVMLLQNLRAFQKLGLPILVGVSRKAFIGTYGGEADPPKRVPGSLAAALFALQEGATLLRVHDVAETVQAVRVWRALSEKA